MLIGCQFAIYPMEREFVPIILDAIAPLRQRDDVRVEGDDLSTYVAGSSAAVFAAVGEVYARACRAGGHVVLSATWSRGCPGEPGDPICCADGNDPAHEPLPTFTDSAQAVYGSDLAPKNEQDRVITAAQCALYPLGTSRYMQHISDEIERFTLSGQHAGSTLRISPKHFCTRMDGELSEVLHALHAAFVRAGHLVRHVVLQATLSKGSPSTTKATTGGTHE